MGGKTANAAIGAATVVVELAEVVVKRGAAEPRQLVAAYNVPSFLA
jgi:hypothetical protein